MGSEARAAHRGGVRAQRRVLLGQGNDHRPGPATGAGGVLGRREEEADRLGLRPDERVLDFHLLAGPKGLTGQLGQCRGRWGCWPASAAPAHARIVRPQMVRIAMCRLLCLTKGLLIGRSSSIATTELMGEMARTVCWGMWSVNRGVEMPGVKP
jgi:hypothetical protein